MKRQKNGTTGPVMARWLVCVGGLAMATAVQATRFPLPPADVDVVGKLQFVEASADETLLDIGRRHGLGYEEMVQANPGVDIWLPGEGTLVVVPTRFVLPDAPRTGVVLNVAEMRIYYYPPADGDGRRFVETYPVAIGRMDWSTPLGETRITEKVKNPYWYPPESIREEAAADGQKLPEAVPPGPNNPLGRFKMRLGIPGYLIHGTNRPWGVGMRVTHGCVRMYPEDIEQLFPRITVDTPVRIVNQPVKAGWAAGELFVEVHPILEEERGEDEHRFGPAIETVAGALGRSVARVDHRSIVRALERQSGMPVPVTREPLLEQRAAGTARPDDA